MKKLILLLSLAMTGCSTAPLAGFLDAVSPSKGKPADTTLPRILDDAQPARLEQ